MSDPVRVLFVCLGNICRSPMAEGIFHHYVERAGLEDAIEIDSAGTGPWHVGDPPDERMAETARRHGISLDALRGRQFGETDFESFDHVFVMDKSNLNDVLALDIEEEHGHRVRLFREADPEPGDFQVPDPYYGGADGFENVYEMVDRTCQALLGHLIEEYDLSPREGWDATDKVQA